MATHKIPAQNLPALIDKIATLSRRAVKISGTAINLTVGETIRIPAYHTVGLSRVPTLDTNGQQVFRVFHVVECDAPIVRIDGWTFVATLDHHAAANVIRSVPGLSCVIPESYRTAPPDCDHCRINRRRNDTFLLQNESTGEWKQIGRTCIRDFIGYDVASMVALAECVASVGAALDGELDEDSGYGSGSVGGAYIHSKTYLANVSACIRAYGWVSKKDAVEGKSATATDALQNMFRKASVAVALIESDFESATNAIAWARALPGRSDFEHNMWVVSGLEMIEARSAGILAYFIPGMLRATEKAFAAATKKESLGLTSSQHVGAIGDKLRNIPARLYGYNAIDGRYGTTVIYKFICDSGNVFNWFSSGGIEGLGAHSATNQQRVILAGTVKNHNEYRDEKQTILTRCKVQFVPA